LLEKIDKTRLPRHIAIIMDGNGRWAKTQGKPRIDGHRRGSDVVDAITETAREIGIKYLTLYAFSKENWNRPIDEVRALMQLLKDFLNGKRQKMLDHGIRLNAIGDLRLLPEDVRELLLKIIDDTRVGKEMVLTLALSYGARDEIVRAVKHLAVDLSEGKFSLDHLDEQFFSTYLDTREMPDPDLIIRTSGENRVSNFLLWQAAYAEFIFVEECWPDFNSNLLIQCLIDYQSRERRFGRISEQLD
jgi:undecaprenyl diphosphate synthase